MPEPRLFVRKLAIAGLALYFGISVSSRAEVILQYFETDWNEIYQRIPEIAEAGYDALWTPPPSKSPEAGTINAINRRGIAYSVRVL